MRTVRDEWERFAATVLPRGVSDVQRTETQKAFYAGAISMLALSAELGGDEWTEESGAKQLQAWQDELLRLIRPHLCEGKPG